MLNQDAILAAIIAKNPEANLITSSKVTFSSPSTHTDSLRNTKITITAINGSGLSGSAEFLYHRIGLSELGEIALESPIEFTPTNIVTSINDQFGTELTVADLQNIVVPEMDIEGDVSEIIISAKTNTLGWVGNTEVLLGLNLPSNMDVFNEFVSETLPVDGYLI